MKYDLHKAARLGTLDRLPKECFTKRNLLSATREGWNVFHVASCAGNLTQMPWVFLTEENLLLQDNTMRRSNCIHLAIEGGKVEKFPKEFLTPQNLLKENVAGWNCFHLASLTGQLDKLTKVLNPRDWINYSKELKDLKCGRKVKKIPEITGFIQKVDEARERKKIKKELAKIESLKI